MFTWAPSKICHFLSLSSYHLQSLNFCIFKMSIIISAAWHCMRHEYVQRTQPVFLTRVGQLLFLKIVCKTRLLGTFSKVVERNGKFWILGTKLMLVLGRSPECYIIGVIDVISLISSACFEGAEAGCGQHHCVLSNSPRSTGLIPSAHSPASVELAAYDSYLHISLTLR